MAPRAFFAPWQRVSTSIHPQVQADWPQGPWGLGSALPPTPRVPVTRAGPAAILWRLSDTSPGRERCPVPLRGSLNSGLSQQPLKQPHPSTDGNTGGASGGNYAISSKHRGVPPPTRLVSCDAGEQPHPPASTHSAQLSHGKALGRSRPQVHSLSGAVRTLTRLAAKSVLWTKIVPRSRNSD